MAQVSATSRVTQDAAFESFKQHAVTWRRQSLLLACSAAVCLIAGSHGKRHVSVVDGVDRLKKVIGQTGINKSQIAKYVGTARALVHHVDGARKSPLARVLKARTPMQATEVLAHYLASKKVTTLEDMTQFFGRYKRKPAKRTKTAAVKPVRIGAAGIAKLPVATVEVLLSPATLRRVKPDRIVMVATRAGHSPMALAKAAITSVTKQGDLLELEKALSERMNQLSRSTAVRSASPKRQAA